MLCTSRDRWSGFHSISQVFSLFIFCAFVHLTVVSWFRKSLLFDVLCHSVFCCFFCFLLVVIWLLHLICYISTIRYMHYCCSYLVLAQECFTVQLLLHKPFIVVVQCCLQPLVSNLQCCITSGQPQLLTYFQISQSTLASSTLRCSLQYLLNGGTEISRIGRHSHCIVNVSAWLDSGVGLFLFKFWYSGM